MLKSIMSKPKSKTVRGALPCGNPKRYTSSEVVHMQKNYNPSATSTSEDQSESDQYIKTLLKRQIHTDVTLNQQFSQHRDFTESSTHAPSVSQLQGLHSIDEHLRLDEFDSTIEYLKSCGLTQKEIAFKLKDKISKKNESSGFGAHPVTEEQIVKEIERKLAEKEEALNKPDKFNGGLELSRHALVLEKAILERQNKEATFPEFLFREKKVTVSSHPDDPINHIPAILTDIEPKVSREPRRERRRKRKLDQKLLRQQQYLAVNSDPKARQEFMESVGVGVNSQHNDARDNTTNSNEDDDAGFNRDVKDKERDRDYSNSKEDCCDISENENKLTESFHHCDGEDNQDVRRDDATKTKRKKNNATKISEFFTMSDFRCDLNLVTDEDIQTNKMSLSDILSLPKFQNYEQGNPSKTVFVKNLANTVAEIDLISVFGRYERHGAFPIQLRLLNGRMKGQAFVTFPDIDTAKDVVRDLNGYKLHARPMILSFGKKQNNS